MFLLVAKPEVDVLVLEVVAVAVTVVTAVTAVTAEAVDSTRVVLETSQGGLAEVLGSSPSPAAVVESFFNSCKLSSLVKPTLTTLSDRRFSSEAGLSFLSRSALALFSDDTSAEALDRGSAAVS